MGEDRSRIRINPGVFARLRSFAFNILKSNRRSSLSQDVIAHAPRAGPAFPAAGCAGSYGEISVAPGLRM
jgi:hypothetical protein